MLKNQLIAGGGYPEMNPAGTVLTLLALSGGGEPASWGQRWYGGVVLGVPMGMGFCAPGHCAGWQSWWAAVFLILLVVAVVAAVRGLRQAGTGATAARAGRLPAQATRLALLLAAASTVLLYVRSDAAGNTPQESARYLATLTISLPALLWPLWVAVRRSARVGWRSGWGSAAAPVLVAAALSMAVATVQATTAVPVYRSWAADRQAMIDQLRQLGVRHVYSEYWTCNNITFATHEEIVCAVIDEGDLSPGQDRYPPYRQAVAAAPHPAWVLPIASPAHLLVRRRLAELYPGAEPVTVDTPGYRVYLPPPAVAAHSGTRR
ncbi:hypothetical protein ACN27F_09070 [Solwaraspora sp. WMMB335]|uniref:hypothetical protein n=1 Tax=Solwaraspora sp. WMMB335 TaxID=3404118 RepID=UPI003B9675DB